MARSKHPKPEIEAALQHAEEHGWTIKEGGSHAWGRMFCPYNDETCRCGEFCSPSIWSTPRSPGHHGKQLRRVVKTCAREKARRERAHGDPEDECIRVRHEITPARSRRGTGQLHTRVGRERTRSC